MQVITHRSGLMPILLSHRAEGRTIGFVPTMGALHKGHLSLVAESRRRADITVASVFVNPTQFNDPTDLEKYPRQPEQDAAMLEQAGCDYLYLPGVEDVYPEGTQPLTTFDFNGLDTRLEGASRPGHFAGVAQVVSALLETTVPDYLCMGQKDYQQCMIVRSLLKQMSSTPKTHPLTHSPTHPEWSAEKVQLIICPIVRESNGLAMSSRNVRLSPELRHRAGAIYATIEYARTLLPLLPPDTISEICTRALNTLPDFQTDYLLVLDAETLLPVSANTKNKVVITSVIVGGVRLLDNEIG